MVEVRVGVVDGDEIFRRGVVACLGDEPGLVVHAGATTGVDVVVASAGALPTLDVDVPIVVCADGDPPADPRVAAVLPRAALGVAQLAAAVRAAAAGLHILAAGDPAGGERRPVLGDRELAVLRCLADGLGTRDISRHLGYSERTIKSVIARTCDRLGTRTRAQAVAESYRLHLLDVTMPSSGTAPASRS